MCIQTLPCGRARGASCWSRRARPRARRSPPEAEALSPSPTGAYVPRARAARGVKHKRKHRSDEATSELAVCDGGGGKGAQLVGARPAHLPVIVAVALRRHEPRTQLARRVNRETVARLDVRRAPDRPHRVDDVRHGHMHVKGDHNDTVKHLRIGVGVHSHPPIRERHHVCVGRLVLLRSEQVPVHTSRSCPEFLCPEALWHRLL